LILCGREDNLEKGDDSGFISFTLTRAKSGNVYTRWGTHKQYKLLDGRDRVLFFVSKKLQNKIKGSAL